MPPDNDPEFQTPAIATYPLESLDDIDKLDPERLKLRIIGRSPKPNSYHVKPVFNDCKVIPKSFVRFNLTLCLILR